MLFYYTQIEVVYVLFLNPKLAKYIESTKTESSEAAKETTKKVNERDISIKNHSRNCGKDNMTYRGMLLHYMSIVLFEIYKKNLMRKFQTHFKISIVVRLRSML